MEWSLYKSKSYKDVMKFYLVDSKNRGALSRAAEFLECQKSYLSRVLKTEVHLSIDHAYLLSIHWALSTKEREFFMALVNKERATQKLYREHLEQVINSLRRAAESIESATNRVATDSLSPNDAIYFSSWHWMAIHFLTACPNYQTIPKMAAKIGFKEEVIHATLNQLLKWELVRKENDRWSFNKGNYHLNWNSPYRIINHNNWRSKAVLDAQMEDESFQGLHFTSIQCASMKDFISARAELHKTISEIKKQFDPSPSEEVIVFNLDFFKM